MIKVTVTLTFDLLTSKSIGVLYQSPPTFHIKFEDRRPKCYDKGHCDLDFRSTDLKVNRGLVQVTTNHHVKFEDRRPERSLVIGRTSFYDKSHCDLDL